MRKCSFSEPAIAVCAGGDMKIALAVVIECFEYMFGAAFW